MQRERCLRRASPDRGRRTIITGLGRGIGTWVTTGALEALYKNSEYAIRSDKVIARPFPVGSAADPGVHQTHRKRMISEAGFSIFISGRNDDPSGTKEEYAIARQVWQLCVAGWRYGQRLGRLVEPSLSGSRHGVGSSTPCGGESLC